MASKCRGHQRHWFTLHGAPGARTPVCIRCGAENPKPLKPEEWDELRGLIEGNWRVGRYVIEAVEQHELRRATR